MSTEVKEQVKEEGTFKIKKKIPKKLIGENQIIKVDLTKKQEDAIPAQETNDSDVVVKKPEDSKDSKTVVEEVRPAKEAVENTEEKFAEYAETNKVVSNNFES